MSQFTRRTLMIRSSVQGSALIINHDSKQYLVTANHIVCDKDCDEIKIFTEGKWIDFPCTLIASDDKLDIAILKMPITINVSDAKFEFNMGNLMWGQPVWFLGFPYGLFDHLDIHADGKLPHPYVKWGSVSAMNFAGEEDALCIDAINNVGFSGGPVGFTGVDGVSKILGIVTGYRTKTEFVDGFSSKPKIEDALTYASNTGLVRVVKANPISELIKNHPHGREI